MVRHGRPEIHPANTCVQTIYILPAHPRMSSAYSDFTVRQAKRQKGNRAEGEKTSEVPK
jgi:hypothetical protein